jgi:hypothetical protein
MNNMKFYDYGRSVPEVAMKPINAGRLKGMSDINPMWRIKTLTEMFGPCGIGWWCDIISERLEHDPITKQTAAFVDIKLYYIDPDNGAVSHGIPGTGGASFVAQERNGPYMSDECFKMALTDAISVAAKALGVAADVYFAKDRTKYDTPQAKAPEPAKPKKDESISIKCEECGMFIEDYIAQDGTKTSAFKIAKLTKKETGKCLCKSCYEGRKK